MNTAATQKNVLVTLITNNATFALTQENEGHRMTSDSGTVDVLISNRRATKLIAIAEFLAKQSIKKEVNVYPQHNGGIRITCSVEVENLGYIYHNAAKANLHPDSVAQAYDDRDNKGTVTIEYRF